MAGSLLVHVRAIRGSTIGDDDRPERSIVDHMHIIEALEARDTELSERLVRDHALDLAEHVRSTVEHLNPKHLNPSYKEVGAGQRVRTHQNDERGPT
jgi:DNA-binding GntR family transcriptional regulator